MNDPTLAYGILATIIALILGAIIYLQSKNNEASSTEADEPEQPAVRRVPRGNRAAANMNARARLRATLAERRGEELPEEDEDQDDTRAAAGGAAGAAAGHSDEQEDSDDELATEGAALPKAKLGKKKAAKLQAKAEKKEQRLADEREREEKKERDALKADEQKKKEEQEEAEEQERLEEERKIQEEKQRKDQEEYEKMKAMFSVEDSGFDATIDEDTEKDLLREFVEFIKREKVVVLEELAARFRIKTQAVINRVNELQADGTLTGVLDDRGKFIYISRPELESIAVFIRQRGRVTISELAEASGTLVSLTPDAPAGDQLTVQA